MKDLYDSIHLGGTARSPGDVRRLHDLGLPFAEIAVSDPDSFSELLDEYRSLKESLGVYYLCHGPREGNPNDIGNLEKQYLPKIFKILSLMPGLDMNLLTVHLWLDGRFVKQEVIDLKIDLLGRIIRRAEDLEITICLENLSENSMDMSKPFHDLPSLCLTLDLGHAQLLTDRNTSHDYIAKYPERIKHVHLHDNRGGTSHLDDLHLPPGEGVVEFKTIFQELQKIGYNRTMTIELKPHEIEKCLDSIRALLLL